jgi:hypothetical protein
MGSRGVRTFEQLTARVAVRSGIGQDQSAQNPVFSTGHLQFDVAPGVRFRKG